ncbi:phosphotransferase [Saccharibacter sp. 17.LH.SD]|uniref:phosphotransferase enzyme family protein n=1 Tax=Saccharibacter sp. 17.LH.SD TaxID=2689393 RepID=UPI00136D1E10|nr:phosphotransferase [Saccharibacter sp. 17.LH.SD]MXV43612.1 phosphotransferase [Saccharibacter sp. 17.LH.SD]
MTCALGITDQAQERSWPPLDPDDIRAVLSHFGFQAAALPLSWSSTRPFSSAGQVELANGDHLFLKRHDQRLRSSHDLQKEHSFINWLADKNFPVLQPKRTASGSSIVTYNGGIFELFPIANGTDTYRNTESWSPYHNMQHAEASGTFLAHLHTASQGYDAPPRTHCLLTSSLQPLLSDHLENSLTHWIKTQEGLSSLLPSSWRDDLLPLMTPFHKKLIALRPHITPLWGHGDWHGSNFTWNGNHLSSIFDFGMSNATSAEFDVAVAIERSFIGWVDPSNDVPVASEQLEAFLKGYHHHAGQHPARLDLIACLLPLCHLTFALSEVAYYGHLLHQQDNMDIAYHGYLLGHARWFHTAKGRSLLNKITSYA